jgi:hypothetical protein
VDTQVDGQDCLRQHCLAVIDHCHGYHLVVLVAGAADEEEKEDDDDDVKGRSSHGIWI